VNVVVITEYELIANWHKHQEKMITLPQGSVITPAARDFLRAKRIEVQIEGEGLLDLTKNTYQTSKQTAAKVTVTARGNAPENTPPNDTKQVPLKPEHMTHLRGSELISKTDPIIAYRGQLDLFQCELVEAQLYFQQIGEAELVKQLEEIAEFSRRLMLCEVRNEPFTFTGLLGCGVQELREQSHHPKRYFGVEHSKLSYQFGPVVARLHCLRSRSREVELYANRAFEGKDGNCVRTDIVQALNRLSSAFYILTCKVRARGQQIEDKVVPIGISNRHIHLCQAHLDALFGKGYELNVLKDLSQPGQFAAQETVTLKGPKGKLDKVRILGPVRKQTQVEVSVTDCFLLGVKPVVRDSGQLDGTQGITIIGPAGEVTTDNGVMVASRHIHFHTDQANAWGLKDGQRVKVCVPCERPIVFDDVLVRVGDQYKLEFHLDTDEANAALLGKETTGTLVGV
jgi:propanediol utilization protein